MKPITVTRKL